MKEHETSQPLADKRFRMIDVGGKRVTHRKAWASGRIHVGETAFRKIAEKTMPKGDVLALSEVAGISGAKNVAQLLPLCHPLPIESIEVGFELLPKENTIQASCFVSSHAKTGVEMEALAGVQAALLCIYDLTKGVEPALQISGIHLERKEGGKAGVWTPEGSTMPLKKKTMSGVSLCVLTISDRCSLGRAEDLSGPELVRLGAESGAELNEIAVVPDSESAIQETVLGWNAPGRLIVSTGGTGLGPRDVTITSLRKLADKEIPGLGEKLRTHSAQFTNKAWLSEVSAFVVKESLVVALPGSVKAVAECWPVIEELVPHAIHVLQGGGH